MEYGAVLYIDKKINSAEKHKCHLNARILPVTFSLICFLVPGTILYALTLFVPTEPHLHGFLSRYSYHYKLHPRVASTLYALFEQFWRNCLVGGVGVTGDLP